MIGKLILFGVFLIAADVMAAHFGEWTGLFTCAAFLALWFYLILGKTPGGRKEV